MLYNFRVFLICFWFFFLVRVGFKVLGFRELDYKRLRVLSFLSGIFCDFWWFFCCCRKIKKDIDGFFFRLRKHFYLIKFRSCSCIIGMLSLVFSLSFLLLIIYIYI